MRQKIYIRKEVFGKIFYESHECGHGKSVIFNIFNIGFLEINILQTISTRGPWKDWFVNPRYLPKTSMHKFLILLRIKNIILKKLIRYPIVDFVIFSKIFTTIKIVDI